jgi:hypothetical protein
MKDSLLEIAASTQSEMEITHRIEHCATRDLDIGMGQRWMRELLHDQNLNQVRFYLQFLVFDIASIAFRTLQK